MIKHTPPPEKRTPKQIREQLNREQVFPDGTSLWDRFWSRVVLLLAFMQEFILWNLVREPCWRGGDGRVLRVSQMDERHIRNCISLLDRNGQSEDRVYAHFSRELNNRYRIRMNIGPDESDAFLRHHRQGGLAHKELEVWADRKEREGTRVIREDEK